MSCGPEDTFMNSTASGVLGSISVIKIVEDSVPPRNADSPTGPGTLVMTALLASGAFRVTLNGTFTNCVECTGFHAKWSTPRVVNCQIGLGEEPTRRDTICQ